MYFKIELKLLIMLLFAFVLTSIPLTDFLNYCRPPWVLLGILFIQLYYTNYYKIYFAVILGLFLDALLVCPLGEHSLAILVATWVGSGQVRKFPMYSLLSQITIMTLLTFIYLCIIELVEMQQGHGVPLLSILLTIMISFFVLPWIRHILIRYVFRGNLLSSYPIKY